jgi:ParB family chromosome partitioning protein
MKGFEIVAGHRRFQACRHLRWRFLPCKIKEMSDRQTFEIQLTENIQRKSMNPIEEAEAFRKYVTEYGWGGTSELARKIGKSEEYVSHRMQLLHLSYNVKKQIISNQIKVSQALELTSLSVEKQNEVVSHIQNDNLTVRHLRKMKKDLTNEIDQTDNHVSFNKSSYLKTVKKTTLTLKIALARIDSLIEDVRTTASPHEKAALLAFLMDLRLTIHSMIDETIHFKNLELKARNIISM